MSVSSLFTSALQVVMNDVTRHEREFPYLPSNVRTQLGKVMSRRGLLCARNMPLVLHEGVTSLDLSECHLGEEEVGLVWRLCPRLKKLDIGVRRGSRSSLSTGALTQLLSHLPSLLSLNLQSCSLLSDPCLLPLSSSSSYLTSLTLSGCPLVSDPGLLAIASRLSYLQALGLAYTQVSSVGLTALSKGVCAKVLKELDFSHCRRVGDEGVLPLLSRCPSLSILVLHGCPLLTSRSRDSATNHRGHKLKQVTWTVY